MASVIQTMDKWLDKTVYALTQHGLSERIALHLIIDVCKGRLRRIEG